MARRDLNAVRAARTEAENEPHEVVLGFDASGAEQVFALKPTMPLEVLGLLNRGQGEDALKMLLVDESDWERMRVAVPDENDLLEIINLYSVDAGEAPASSRSSTNGGTRSRRTSKGSTTSTSRKRAGGPRPSASDASKA